MTNDMMWDIVHAQLARDLGCQPDLFQRPGNQIVPFTPLPGRRTDASALLQIYVLHGFLYAAAVPELLPWCQEFLPPRMAEWLFVPKNLRAMESELGRHGWELENLHQYYLPRLPSPPVSTLGPIRWYEAQDLISLRGDPRWGEALALNSDTPDMLAVAALDAVGEPVAMAGASRDCQTMWQIGINVNPQVRGRGLGANLTALLKQALLDRGIVPFYSTAGSHIASQSVALKAGFFPAWATVWAQEQEG